MGPHTARSGPDVAHSRRGLILASVDFGDTPVTPWFWVWLTTYTRGLGRSLGDASTTPCGGRSRVVGEPCYGLVGSFRGRFCDTMRWVRKVITGRLPTVGATVLGTGVPGGWAAQRHLG